MSRIKTTGDIRKFLANVAVSVAQGETDVHKATAAIKACKEISTSLYSEIKVNEMFAQAGKGTSALGDLPIHGNE